MALYLMKLAKTCEYLRIGLVLVFLGIGSRPSDHYFRSVCWFVCLSVWLFVCAVFLSRLWSDFDQTWTYVTCLCLVVSQEWRSLVGVKISGGRGRPWGIFLVSTKLDTFCYPTVQTAPCYVPSFWHKIGVWRTDGQTDGIAVANTALAIRALRCAVKKKFNYT